MWGPVSNNWEAEAQVNHVMKQSVQEFATQHIFAVRQMIFQRGHNFHCNLLKQEWNDLGAFCCIRYVISWVSCLYAHHVFVLYWWGFLTSSLQSFNCQFLSILLLFLLSGGAMCAIWGIIRSHVIPACNTHSTLLCLSAAIALTEPSPIRSYPVWLSNMLTRHTRLFCTEFRYTSGNSAVKPPFYLCSSYRDLIFETRNKKIWNQSKNDHKTQIFAPCWDHKNNETPLLGHNTRKGFR